MTTIATARERPVQRRTHVVDLVTIRGQPIRRGLSLPLRCGCLEHGPLVFGMAAGKPLEFASLDQFFERIGTSGFEQPVL